jgi:RNA polymerase sigma-70 factor (ECF subfamily)
MRPLRRLATGEQMRIAMAAVAGQAPEDLDAVFREYAPMIYRTARMVTGSAEDAEDIVQTIFLRLLRGDYTLKLQGNPRGYFHQAAVNLSLDVLRRRRRRTFIHDVDTVAAPEPAGSSDRLAHQQLDAALAELEPEAVHILTLRYVHGYKLTEIAGLLGTSRGAIALRFFRVRQRLKKLLAITHGEMKR